MASAATAAASSHATNSRAALCLTAWKLPIFWPNCSRTLAYSTEASRHQRITPAASAAISATTTVRAETGLESSR